MMAGAAVMTAAPGAMVAIGIGSGAAAAAAGAGAAGAGAAGAAAAGAGAGAGAGAAAAAGATGASAGAAAGIGGCFGLFAMWKRQTVAFRAFVYLISFCVLISLVGFIRNSDGLSFSTSIYFSLAKAGGYLLDFGMTAILFPMMRNMISWLRTTPIADVIPLDDSHSLHILIAKIIGVGTLIHVVGHYLNMDATGKDISMAAFGNISGITGHLVLLCMAVMAITSMMRRGITIFGKKFGSFDTFWATHQLYILVYVLLVFHAEAFYRWAFWPLVLYTIDKAIHHMRGQKQCHLAAVRQEAKGTDVMSLQMKVFLDGRLRFHYRCGQYLMLQCPDLGREWHPFTITSAPEEEYVSVHIRCRGDWTKALQQKLNPEGLENVKFHRKGLAASSDAENAVVGKGTMEQPCEIRVDGPYGSGSDRTDEYNTVMLVGTGIGVTPFASVMKSLKIRQEREGSSVRPNKVYFYWVCRDQKEFEWFSWLIEELSNLGDRFELNTYLTGELDLDQMIKQHGNNPNALQAEEKQALIKAGALKHRKSNKVNTEETEILDDSGANLLVGGKDTKTAAKWAGKKWAGRPNWRRIFKEKAQTHEGEEIGVFLCGPGAAELEDMCRKSSDEQTAFVFHKEVF